MLFWDATDVDRRHTNQAHMETKLVGSQHEIKQDHIPTSFALL